MARYWATYWQNRRWCSDVNEEYAPLCYSGSNSYRKRGISAGDSVYIVSVKNGQLLLGGRMRVVNIVTRDAAVRIWKNDRLYDATEWIIDEEKSGTPLNLHRRLAPNLTRKLRFSCRGAEDKEPYFVSATDLDHQTFRGVREVTSETAALLNEIIDITDRMPRSGDEIVVTEEVIGQA